MSKRRPRWDLVAAQGPLGVTEYALKDLTPNACGRTVSGGRGRLSPKELRMRLEGALRSHQVHRGRRFDIEYYSVLRSEWRKRR